MKEQLKEIEEKILAIFDRIREDIPDLHHLEFSVTKYEHLPKPFVHGFFHPGKDRCYTYNDVIEIYDFWHKHRFSQKSHNLPD